MKNNNIIFFDFDGVIANSFHIAFEVAKLSKPTLTAERYKEAFGGNINDAKYTDKVVRQIDWFKEYGQRFLDLDIATEKQQIIKKLAKDFSLFIISSTTGDIIREYLARHNILDCFTEILGNEISTSKVEKFNLLFNKYNINVENVVFITDSSGDINEARKVNIEKIAAILGGYQNKESLKKSNPTVIVKNFSEFYDFVKFLGKK